MRLALVFPLELPEDWIPVDAISVIKCMAEDGEPALCIRATEGLASWDIVGLLVGATDIARKQFVDDYQDG